MASTASRTAGSAAPHPESIAFRVAFTSSITRAIATLNRNDSTAKDASCSALCVALRSERSPLLKSTPGADVTSPDKRHARLKNFTEPDGETSDQSTSSSGGPEKTIDRRIASTPWFSSSSDKRTKFPRDFDIAEPSITTIPWLRRRVNGSVNESIFMSYKTLVKKREYNKCKIAWVTPPTY